MTIRKLTAPNRALWTVATGTVGLWGVGYGLYAIGALAWTVATLLLLVLFVLILRSMDAPYPDAQMTYDMKWATGIGAALVVMIVVFL